MIIDRTQQQINNEPRCGDIVEDMYGYLFLIAHDRTDTTNLKCPNRMVQLDTGESWLLTDGQKLKIVRHRLVIE